MYRVWQVIALVIISMIIGFLSSAYLFDYSIDDSGERFNIMCHYSDRASFHTSNASKLVIPDSAVSFNMNTKGSPKVYLWANCRAEEIK